MAAFAPETPLEQRIMDDPEWRAGLIWGAPRPGHPEGTVERHLADVLANVDRVAIDADDRARLRLVALVHDAFKHAVDRSQPKTGENHHAMRARRFAERYVEDTALLDVIELHDEGYIAWRGGLRTGDWEAARSDARAVIGRIGPALTFFMRFYWVDNETDGKTSRHRWWFAALAAGDDPAQWENAEDEGP